MVLKIDKRTEKPAPKPRAESATRIASTKVAASRSIKSLWRKLGRPGSLKTFVASHDDDHARITGKQWLANKKLRGRG